jgi:D-sedoheptulose 7-phosphate isomerase
MPTPHGKETPSRPIGYGSDPGGPKGYLISFPHPMDHQRHIKESFDRHLTVANESLAKLLPEIERAFLLLHAAMTQGRMVFACGNGGSAADAQHFATEFVSRYMDDRVALPAHALTTDTSALTAIANDYGFERLFSRQVEALGKEGDILVAFTTSGASKNVLHALAAARGKGMGTIVLTGEKGGHLAAEADVALAVPSRETARIQEVHELIFHIWCEHLDRCLVQKA